MGICERCPLYKKIKLYEKAGRDRDLARQEGKTQGIGNDVEGLVEHFANTAEMLKIACKSELLCRKYFPELVVQQEKASVKV